MLKNIHIGSIVTYLDDNGKYPYIKQGSIAAISGNHYIVNDQRLHYNQLFDTSQESSRLALYRAVKIRIWTLQSLVTQLEGYLRNEQILKD